MAKRKEPVRDASDVDFEEDRTVEELPDFLNNLATKLDSDLNTSNRKHQRFPISLYRKVTGALRQATAVLKAALEGRPGELPKFLDKLITDVGDTSSKGQLRFESHIDLLVSGVLAHYFPVKQAFLIGPQYTYIQGITDARLLEIGDHWSRYVAGSTMIWEDDTQQSDDAGPSTRRNELSLNSDPFDPDFFKSMVGASTPKAPGKNPTHNFMNNIRSPQQPFSPETPSSAPTASGSLPSQANAFPSPILPSPIHPMPEMPPPKSFMKDAPSRLGKNDILDFNGRLVMNSPGRITIKRPDLVVCLLEGMLNILAKNIVIVEDKLFRRMDAVKQLLGYMKDLEDGCRNALGLAVVLTTKFELQVAMFRRLCPDGPIEALGATYKDLDQEDVAEARTTWQNWDQEIKEQKLTPTDLLAGRQITLKWYDLNGPEVRAELMKVWEEYHN
ncbi:hypothetical protein BDZ89DRAFT_1158780 [Hymenopellis radicata]|nr:hypothetical protein BDZ89DRAFT_1158780 [Hymenopellis radicata]